MNAWRILGRKLKFVYAAFLALFVALSVLLGGCGEIVTDQMLEYVAGEVLGELEEASAEERRESSETTAGETLDGSSEETPAIAYGESYTTAEDVALYLHTYQELPPNFITKKEAQALGWPGGSLEEYAPGKCIGGDRFGNYEGLLPESEGRTYKECDIDTLGAKSRGARRIVFSNDGLIYYTLDHYESFELLYGEEDG